MSTEIQKLEEEILLHNEKYWVDSDPIISDEEYDLMVERLKAVHPESDIFEKLEEQKSKENHNKYVHSEPMLSLEKFYSKEKVFEWMRKISRSMDERFKLQLKLDGISGKLENGNLATRGNGKIGENHTVKIPYMDFRFASNKTVCKDANCTVNGEIIITDEFFEKNLKGEYKNSRNAVAGLVGRKTAEKIKGMGVTFVDFDLDCLSHTGNIDAFILGWDSLVKHLTSQGYPYDGLVIKLADEKYYRELGNKTKTPKGAIAYKFANKSAVTKVKSITWQVSRNGKLTPVCELHPVELAGVTIKRATAHNANFLAKHFLAPEVKIIIERAGEVIPKVIENIDAKHDENFSGHHAVIKDCPCCGTSVEPSYTDGVLMDYYCPNEDCRDRVIEHILFMSKTIGIEEMGRPTVEKLIDYKQIFAVLKNVSQFQHILLDDLQSLNGYGEKSAVKLHNNIKNSLKNVDEVHFLATFGISGLGRTMFTKILDDVKGIRNLFDIVRYGDVERLKSIKGVGDVSAPLIIEEFPKKRVEQIYGDFLSFIGPIIEKDYSIDVEAPTGERICFTGKMPEKRSHYEAIAKERGLIPSKVDKQLDILVIAEEGWTSGKVTKAEKLGSKIMTLDEWL